MAKITFVEHDGTEHVLEGEDGMTVMELAIKTQCPALTPIAAVPVHARPVMSMYAKTGRTKLAKLSRWKKTCSILPLTCATIAACHARLN